MIRVVAVDEETGERWELSGSSAVLIVHGDVESSMVTAGAADSPEVACEMIQDAHERVREDELAPRGAAIH